MASNPHSDFTTHNRTLPTLSNLPIFATGGWLPFADCVAFVLVHPEPVSGEFYTQSLWNSHFLGLRKILAAWHSWRK